MAQCPIQRAGREFRLEPDPVRVLRVLFLSGSLLEGGCEIHPAHRESDGDGRMRVCSDDPAYQLRLRREPKGYSMDGTGRY
jgi:hypothetical protein